LKVSRAVGQSKGGGLDLVGHKPHWVNIKKQGGEEMARLGGEGEGGKQWGKTQIDREIR